MKQKIFIFIISLFIYCVTAFFRGGYVTLFGLIGFPLSSLIGFVLYFSITYLFLIKFTKKIKRVHILLLMLLGCVIFELPFRIMDLILGNFASGLISIPDILVKVIAILLSYWTYIIKKGVFKIALASLSFLFIVWMSFCGYNMWIHKLSYETISGKIEKKYVKNVEFQTSESDTLSLDYFRGKYLVLDHWNTSCGVCYEKFPQVQKFYDVYKNNPELVFYAVHSRGKNGTENEDARKGARILKERGYTFPCLSIDIDNPVLKELGVDGYPTVLIFDKRSDLVFRGNIKNASKFVEKVLKN